MAIFALSNDSIDLGTDDFEDMRTGAAGTSLPAMDEPFRQHFEEKYTYPALEITYLAVSKQYQRKDIGTAIIGEIAQLAREQNLFGCIFLTVKALHTKTYSAKAFYEKNDFALLSPTPSFDTWPMYRTLWES